MAQPKRETTRGQGTKSKATLHCFNLRCELPLPSNFRYSGWLHSSHQWSSKRLPWMVVPSVRRPASLRRVPPSWHHVHLSASHEPQDRETPEHTAAVNRSSRWLDRWRSSWIVFLRVRYTSTHSVEVWGIARQVKRPAYSNTEWSINRAWRDTYKHSIHTKDKLRHDAPAKRRLP